MKVKTKRLYWIDGIKLFACFFVFFSHFQGFFFESCKIDMGYSKVMDVFLSNPCNFLKNGNFWMCLFCVVSGYFASSKKIENIKDLLSTIFKRYFRFFIPLLAANFFAFIVANTIGFYTQKYGVIFKNDWLMEYYNFKVTLWIVVRASIKLTSELNSPLWMLRPLFFGTCAIYVINYLSYKTSKKLVYIVSLLCCGIIVFFFPEFHNTYLYSFVTCFGVLVRIICDKKLLKIDKWYINILFIMLTFLAPYWISVRLIDIIGGHITVASYITKYLNAIYAVILLLTINNMKNVKEVLEYRVFRMGQKLSFGIYVTHWIVISSFSLLLYERLSNQIQANMMFWMNFFITTVVVLVLSILFHVIIENYAMNMFFKLCSKFERKGE